MDVATGKTHHDWDVNGWPEWVDEDTLMLEVGVD